MDLRSILNDGADGAATAAAAAAHAHPHVHAHPHAQSQAAHAHLHPHPHQSPLAPQLKTPQRTVSLVHPPHSYTTSSHSPPPVAEPIPLPRTTSLPAQVKYRRESSASVSPKTMPPPAPLPYQTPSPVMSRKRSLSISDHQHTPQPVLKRRKYDPKSPPPWARRERDGHRFVLTPRSDPSANVTPQPNTQPQPQNNVKQGSAPPATPSQPPSAQLQPPPAHQAPPESSFEPSLDNLEPYNDMERQICDFLFQNIVLQDWQFSSATKVEVEAKLGSIKDWDNSGERLRLPILTDAVLNPNLPRPRFESSMKTDQHARLNKYLNSVTQQSQRPGRQPIQYKHTRETDLFYDIPQHALHLIDPVVMDWHNRSGGRGAPRLRVTRDNASGDVTAVIIKTRIANVEVRCPADDFDFRVSISLETPWTQGDWTQFPEHLDHGVRTTRSKDRLSYRHQGFLVDLTQVTPFARQGEKVDKLHELEVEMDVDRLVDEGYKNMNGQTNEYEKLVHVFLNNVKVVNRAAKAPPQTQQGPPHGGPMR